MLDTWRKDIWKVTHSVSGQNIWHSTRRPTCSMCSANLGCDGLLQQTNNIITAIVYCNWWHSIMFPWSGPATVPNMFIKSLAIVWPPKTRSDTVFHIKHRTVIIVCISDINYLIHAHVQAWPVQCPLDLNWGVGSSREGFQQTPLWRRPTFTQGKAWCFVELRKFGHQPRGKIFSWGSWIKLNFLPRVHVLF